MKRIILRAVYMLILPTLYVIALIGLLIRNNYSLDGSQIIVLTMFGGLIIYAWYIIYDMTKKRKPKFLGTGIHVHNQTFNDIIKGDTFWDADFGMMIWNGKSWESKK